METKLWINRKRKGSSAYLWASQWKHTVLIIIFFFLNPHYNLFSERILCEKIWVSHVDKISNVSQWCTSGLYWWSVLYTESHSASKAQSTQHNKTSKRRLPNVGITFGKRSAISAGAQATHWSNHTDVLSVITESKVKSCEAHQCLFQQRYAFSNLQIQNQSWQMMKWHKWDRLHPKVWLLSAHQPVFITLIFQCTQFTQILLLSLHFLQGATQRERSHFYTKLVFINHYKRSCYSYLPISVTCITSNLLILFITHCSI